jgi:hypothetical protein
MDSTIIIEKSNHFSRFCGYNAYGYVFYLQKGKLQLGFKIGHPTEQVKVDFTTTSRWFKVISKEEFEPNTPNKFYY